jgi:hypothetical protein
MAGGSRNGQKELGVSPASQRLSPNSFFVDFLESIGVSRDDYPVLIARLLYFY